MCQLSEVLPAACMQALRSLTMTSAWRRTPSQTCRSTGSRPSRRCLRSGSCSAALPPLHRQAAYVVSSWCRATNATAETCCWCSQPMVAVCRWALDLAASPTLPADVSLCHPQAEEQFPSLGGQPGSGMAAAPAAQHLASAADASVRGRHADSSQPGRPHAESQQHALARQFFPDEFEDVEDPGGGAVQARQQRGPAAQRSTAPTTRRHACPLQRGC